MSTLPLSPVSMLCGVCGIFAGIYLLHVLKILQLTGVQREACAGGGMADYLDCRVVRCCSRPWRHNPQIPKQF